MPAPLVDDLVEEVLLRLPPHEPASLVRAALVCRRWHSFVTDPGFSRRFREFHRRPPMLGMLCNRSDVHEARFVPMTVFCSPEADRGHWRVLDARHGRVLLSGKERLVVWDPITNEEQMLPIPPQYSDVSAWTAAVLCAASAGACDHLDCCHRPIVVVLLASVFLGSDAGRTFICTYESETAAWSEPICNKGPRFHFFSLGSTLVGNALYFTEFLGSIVLKYNLELREISCILLPSSSPPLPFSLFHDRRQSSVLFATENGELGLATNQGSKLCIWMRKHVGDEWQKPSRGIMLKTLLPDDAALSKLDVVGSVEGAGIIFMQVDDVVYTIDLKTSKVKKVYKGKVSIIVPYMSFYTPACTGSEAPSVDGPIA